MKKVAYIDPKICEGEAGCIPKKVCKEKAIEQGGGGYFGGGIAKVIIEKCTGCGACVKYCSVGAIKLKESW